MFAIVKITGKQYKVEKDSEIEVDRIDGDEGKTLEFTDVLLRGDDKAVEVGTPTVAGAKVLAKVVKQFQGEKVTVRRYKQKVRYRKTTGFRAQLTRLHITAIS
jgi:large subunit ribosomal protein L21